MGENFLFFVAVSVWVKSVPGSIVLVIFQPKSAKKTVLFPEKYELLN
jgi:hypothetical protein